MIASYDYEGNVLGSNGTCNMKGKGRVRHNIDTKSKLMAQNMRKNSLICTKSYDRITIK
jgi:hypothetical protein